MITIGSTTVISRGRYKKTVFTRRTVPQRALFIRKAVRKWTVSTAERQLTYPEDNDTYAEDGSAEDDIDAEDGSTEDDIDMEVGSERARFRYGGRW